MAYNFPDAPTYGQVFLDYSWDGEKWVVLGGVSVPPPVWTPAQLTGLIGWYDMKEPANYTVTGTQVVSMIDMSGNGNLLGSASTSQKPTYSATGLNGLPTMLCDGGLTHIETASPFPMGTGNTLTVFAVGTLTSGAWNYARIVGYQPVGFLDNNHVSGWCLLRSANVANMFFNRNTTGTGVVAASYSVPHRFIGTVNSSGVMTCYVDGVASTTATLSGNWVTGGQLNVATGDTNIAKWASQISEVGVATGFSDATAVAQLDTYLKIKWGLDPAANFLARTSGLDATHVNAYTALINGLVTDGVWDKLDVLHIYATQNTATAQLNLVSTSYPATLNGSPTFTADRGYTGVDSSTTTYINPGFNAATAVSPKHVQNSAHLSVWNVTNLWAIAPGIGTYISASGNANMCWPRDSASGWSYLRINVASGIDNLSMPNASGHFIANRSASNARQGYRNGAIAVSGGQASIAVTNAPIYALGANVDGAPKGAAFQLAMASIGSSLDATQATAFYNRLRTYMTAVGVP